jgi:DNA-binding CsgD family transcriptional regulator
MGAELDPEVLDFEKRRHALSPLAVPPDARPPRHAMQGPITWGGLCLAHEALESLLTRRDLFSSGARCGVALAAAHQTPAALILITDLDRRPEVLGRRLVELFGLTAAEACLAVALVAGKRLEDIAEERGVRMPTLRTQMRGVLDKTGTDRQADLMRLIVRLPSARMR